MRCTSAACRPATSHTTCSAKQPTPGIASTRSPTARPSTAAPVSSTVPAASWPGTNGGSWRCWYWPRITSVSGKFTAAASTPMRTCPGPQSGAGTSSTRRTSSPPSSGQTSARIRAPPTPWACRDRQGPIERDEGTRRREAPSMAPVPERIDVGDGIVLERARANHAAAVARAVGESLDHLRPFLPWADDNNAREPTQRNRLRNTERLWDADREYQYTIRAVDDDDAPVVGGIGIVCHDRWGVGRDAAEIGYWVHVDWCNRGIATRATAALGDAALGIPGVARVVVVCDAANDPSNAVPRKLGYTFTRVVEREPEAPGETGRMQVWVRTEEDG